MKGTKTVLLPKLTKILEEVGENIKLARLRRKLTAEQVSERAGISRSTLWQVEKGLPSVSFGTYAQVLFVLGLEKDLLLIAKDDILGRKLQDAELSVGKRAPKNK
jgi:transcriptional regulator with XRE-family HTH domain